MLKIRDAIPSDGELLLTYVRELAAFENMTSQCWATQQHLHNSLFVDKIANAIMAEWDGEPAGFAVYYYNFSTFTAQRGLYLEDVYIREPFRRKGIGKAIFRDLAARALNRACVRMEWGVLNWNENAISLYEGIGAKAVHNWQVQRMSRDAIEQLAAERRNTV